MYKEGKWEEEEKEREDINGEGRVELSESCSPDRPELLLKLTWCVHPDYDEFHGINCYGSPSFIGVRWTAPSSYKCIECRY